MYDLLTLGSLSFQRPSHEIHRLRKRIPRSNEEANGRSQMLLVYTDDIIIIGDGTFEIHMKDVKEVLEIERLVDKGLQINPDKSSWARDLVEYLGYLLNRDGVEP